MPRSGRYRHSRQRTRGAAGLRRPPSRRIEDSRTRADGYGARSVAPWASKRQARRKAQSFRQGTPGRRRATRVGARLEIRVHRMTGGVGAGHRYPGTVTFMADCTRCGGARGGGSSRVADDASRGHGAHGRHRGERPGRRCGRPKDRYAEVVCGRLPAAIEAGADRHHQCLAVELHADRHHGPFARRQAVPAQVAVGRQRGHRQVADAARRVHRARMPHRRPAADRHVRARTARATAAARAAFASTARVSGTGTSRATRFRDRGGKSKGTAAQRDMRRC